MPKRNKPNLRGKKLTLITNSTLVQLDQDNKLLQSFVQWADVSNHIELTDIIKVIKVLVSRELKRKR